MSRLVHSVFFAALIAIAAIGSGAALAAKKDRGGEMSAAEAAAEVQRRTGGQALGVEEQQVEGRKVYRVRVLTRDGRVREISVDARERDN